MPEKWPWAQPVHRCVELMGSWMWWNGFYHNEACPGGGNLPVETHRSLLLPTERLLPRAREPAPIKGWDAPSDDNCFSFAQGRGGFAPRWSRSRGLLRDVQLLTQTSSAAKVRVEDAISAAVSEAWLSLRHFQRKYSVSLALCWHNFYWKGKWETNRTLFQRALVQTTALSDASHAEAAASGGDQAAFTERLQLNLFSFSPPALCQCFQSQPAWGKRQSGSLKSLYLTTKHLVRTSNISSRASPHRGLVMGRGTAKAEAALSVQSGALEENPDVVGLSLRPERKLAPVCAEE